MGLIAGFKRHFTSKKVGVKDRERGKEEKRGYLYYERIDKQLQSTFIHINYIANDKYFKWSNTKEWSGINGY